MSLKNKTLDTYVSRGGLLAKWREDGQHYRSARGLSLRQHLREVLLAMNFLFTEPFHRGKEYPSLGHALYTLMDLKRFGVTLEDFRTWCFLSALAHDLGKCGWEFQYMLWTMEHELRVYLDSQGAGGDFYWSGVPSDLVADLRDRMSKIPRERQQYRHELLSLFILFYEPSIREWFTNLAGGEDGFTFILAAVYGHHLKGQKDRAIRSVGPQHQPGPVFLGPMCRDVIGLLEENLGVWVPTPPFPEKETSVPDYIQDLERNLSKIERDPRFWNAEAMRRAPVEDNPVSSAIKWLTIYADTLGSINGKPGESAAGTRKRLFDHLRKLFKPGEVNYYQRIIRGLSQGKDARNWDEVLEAEPEKQREFLLGVAKGWQLDVAVDQNLIATATTGTGKTFGSFWWAAVRPELRLLFCGTTTDAVTALWSTYGEEDYLKHMRAQMDLEEMALTSAPDDSEDDAEAAMRIFRGFDSDVTFTTADSVLGLMAYSRPSIMWLPYLLKAQVVFDEVHSYDPTMKTWYFRFLEWFPGLRTAHLSATVTDQFCHEIERRIEAPYIVRSSGEPSEVEKRFRIHGVTASEIPDLLTPGTLCFTNTVARCQALGEPHPESLLFHARFRYRDKREIRKRIVQVFRRDGPKDLVVVSTQAGQESYDISARRLVSEIAPLEAQLQRLGRVGRFGEFGIVDVYFYMPEMDNGLPYVRSADWEFEYKKWMDWTLQFEGREVSQMDLEDAFQAFYRANPKVGLRDIQTPLLETRRLPVRQSSLTCPALLTQDLIDTPDLTHSEAQRLAIPVNLPHAERRALRHAGKIWHRTFYEIGDGYGRYDARLGWIGKKS